MKDEEIVELFWNRSESSIQGLAKKYEKYCYTIAYGILHNHEDAQECINDVEYVVDKLILEDLFNDFLGKLSKEKRIIFIRRYWYMSSIREIAKDFDMSESKVKMMLLRMRKEFRVYLEKEGVQI